MKNNKLVLFVFTFLIMVSTSSYNYAQHIQKVSIKQVDSIIKNSTAPLVVNFWATFCVPCIEEMPHFKKAQKAYAAKGVQFLLVSLDVDSEYPLGIARFIKKQKINMPVVWLDETDPNYYMPFIHKDWQGTVPVTLFINNKTAVKNFVANKLSKKQLENNIKSIL
jgi:thiol-disulfide isomerase/thioredoxin